MLWIALVACSGGNKSSDDTAVTDDTGGDTEQPDAVCTEPTEVPCVDEMILDLTLHDDKTSNADVTSESDGDDTLTFVDASGGGYSTYLNRPWTYIRFEEDGGVTRVEVDDETALEDMTWHLAFRRYMIRLNSGDGGPSCVGAAAMERTTYADLTEVPDGVTFAIEDFYDDECVMQEDNSGLPDSPALAMGAWWDYPNCVDPTEVPFLVQLDDGRVLKLVVEEYYDDLGEQCDNGSVTSASGGFIWMRWRVM